MFVFRALSVSLVLNIVCCFTAQGQFFKSPKKEKFNFHITESDPDNGPNLIIGLDPMAAEINNDGSGGFGLAISGMYRLNTRMDFFIDLFRVYSIDVDMYASDLEGRDEFVPGAYYSAYAGGNFYFLSKVKRCKVPIEIKQEFTHNAHPGLRTKAVNVYPKVSVRKQLGIHYALLTYKAAVQDEYLGRNGSVIRAEVTSSNSFVLGLAYNYNVNVQAKVRKYGNRARVSHRTLYFDGIYNFANTYRYFERSEVTDTYSVKYAYNNKVDGESNLPWKRMGWSCTYEVFTKRVLDGRIMSHFRLELGARPFAKAIGMAGWGEAEDRQIPINAKWFLIKLRIGLGFSAKVGK